MFRHVLVAVDFSPATDALLDCLAYLKPLGVELITLVYVQSIRYPHGPETEHESHYRSRLEEKKALLKTQGFAVDVSLRVGYPAVEILAAAHDREADFVLIGSHGYSLAKEVALGSVATNVIHDSDLPVLLMRLEVVEEGRERVCKLLPGDMISHVFYATDFSETAVRAFEYVKALASAGCKKATLIHVQETAKVIPHLEHRLEEFTRIDQERLEVLKQRLHSLGVSDVEIDIARGNPSKEILNRIATLRPRLVVMGTHGRGFISELFIGSVSHNVVRHSSAPVLLIPPTSRESY